MSEGVALLLGKGIHCLNASQFGSWEFREASLRLQLLLLQYLDLLVRSALLQGHGLDGEWLGSGLHLSYKEVMIRRIDYHSTQYK
jgi:hypothetical protein